ncbi:MAG: hypothetical protein EOP11_06785 [Proteobacteria bacterium]|nr:MAG: hypothetical protein EOP11_06785 [Pseudomonadota bacterium]
MAKASDEIGNNWLIVIQAIEAKGVKKVGTFSVRAFRNKAAGISWHAMEEAPPAILAGSRRSAVYYKAQRKIFVNTATFGVAERVSLPQLELHELLGATGYDDSSYQSSMALLDISAAATAAEASRLAKLYGSTIFNAGEIVARNAPRDIPMSLRGEDGGSGTSIGGGGDLPTLHIKAEVMKLVKARGNVSNEFRTAYPNIAFEPITDMSVQAVSIEYTYTRTRTAKGYKEKFSVFVPASRWQANARAQADLIEEIAGKITGIFPAYGNVQTVTFTPRGCPASVKVTYPFSPDISVQSVQQSRAEYMARCMDDGHITQRSSIFPEITRAQEPRRNGVFQFTCTFEHPNMREPEVRLVSSALGQGMLSSISLGWNGADYLTGNISISPQGKIRGTSIHYSANGVRNFPDYTPAQSQAQAYSEMLVDGAIMRLTCSANQ